MAIGAIDQDCIAQWDVESVFNNRCRYQYVGFVAHERKHDFLKFPLRHLAVPHNHARSRNQFLELGRDLVDTLHPIVDKIYLTTALQLVLNR